METKTVLTLLLICSIGFNIYLWMGRQGETPPDTECHITPGFDEPIEISSDELRRFNEEFINYKEDKNFTFGGIFSRSALDAVLCTRECNAIAYTLCRDSSGEIGPENDGVFVAISGVHVEFDRESHTIINIRNVDSKYYIGGYWCPPSCTP